MDTVKEQHEDQEKKLGFLKKNPLKFHFQLPLLSLQPSLCGLVPPFKMKGLSLSLSLSLLSVIVRDNFKYCKGHGRDRKTGK